MDEQTSKQCPLCHSLMAISYAQHFREYCPLKNDVKVNTKSASYANKYMCLRCQKVFDKQQWEYHRKKISECPYYRQNPLYTTPRKTMSDKNDDHDEISSIQNQRSVHHSSRSLSFPTKKDSQSKSRLISTALFSDNIVSSNTGSIRYVAELTDELQLVSNFLQIIVAKAKIPLTTWIQKNSKHISSIYLQKFLQKFVEKSFNELQHQIKTPSFEEFKKVYPNIQWLTILNSSAENIFSKQTIQSAVKGFSRTKKNKIFQAINQIYKNDYQSAFDLFQMQRISILNKRNFRPLKTYDFLTLVSNLFATKEKDLVHIGIDLYLIFQSAQRVKSDRVNIEEGVKKLLEERKNNPFFCELEMKVSKTVKRTNKTSSFILSEQCCLLLEAFGWTQFFKSAALYERMKKIFGFPVYSIKKCMFSEMALQMSRSNKNSEYLKQLADHKEVSTAEIYALQGSKNILKQIKDKLKVPNLRIEYINNIQLQNQLASTFRGFNSARIPLDWYELLKNTLKGYNKEEVNFYVQGAANNTLIEEENSSIIKVPEPPAKLPLVKVERPSHLKICGLQFQLKDQKFVSKSFFTEGRVLKCKNCSSSDDPNANGWVCVFCYRSYHSQCLPQLCECVQKKQPVKPVIRSKRHSNYKQPEGQIDYISSQSQEDQKKKKKKIKDELSQLKMPKRYFGYRWEDLQQIKLLLAARRYQYTPTSILLETYESEIPQQIEVDLRMIRLKKFNLYQKERYFPPLALRISGQPSQIYDGPGFGLYATQKIGNNVFIGEYAADILPGFRGKVVKGYNAIFELIQHEDVEQTILIAPVLRCGYVPLINGSTTSEANCKIARVVINSQIRVILYTCKEIPEGMELTWDYSLSSQEPYLRSTLAQENVNVEQHIRKARSGKSTIQGIVNEGNSCYINSSLQLIRIIFGLLPEVDNPSKVYSIVKKIIKEMYQSTTPLNIKKQKEQLCAISKVFKPNVQSDAHEFLLFLLNHFPEPLKAQIRSLHKKQVICHDCHEQTNKEDLLLIHSIEFPFKNAGKSVFLRNQQIVEDYKCEKSRNITTAKQIEHISDNKEESIYFILHLKRFKYSSKSKIASKIDDEISGQIINSVPGYECIGILTHFGKEINSGHYIALQVTQQTSFITYNDGHIYNSESKDANGYILAFRRLTKEKIEEE